MTDTAPPARHYFAAFPAELENIEIVCTNVKELLTGSNSRDILFDVELLAREALVNAITHGSCMDEKKKVTFELCLRCDDIIMEITDDGEGFDWQKEFAKETQVTSEDDRGFPIFKHYADEVSYNDKGNKLFMKKRINVSCKG